MLVFNHCNAKLDSHERKLEEQTKRLEEQEIMLRDNSE